MYNFDNILARSRNKYSKNILKNIGYSEMSSQPFFKLVKRYFEQYPDASNSEAFLAFFELSEKYSYDLALIPSIGNDTLRLNICNYLLKNPNALRVTYDKIHREEEKKKKRVELKGNTIKYTSNKLVSSRRAVISALTEIRLFKESLSEEDRNMMYQYLNSSKKMQQQFRKTCSAEVRRYIDSVKIYFEGNEYTQLYNFLKENIPYMERKLKDEYIASLEFLGNKFKELDLLKKYKQEHQKIMERLNLQELECPLSEDETNSISLESLFTKKELEKLSISELAILNAFWLNRYAKEIEAMNQAFFVTTSLDLWHSIKKAEPDSKTGIIHINIEKDELENTFKKIYFLHEAYQNMISNIRRAKDDEKKIVIQEKDGVETRFIDYTDKMYKESSNAEIDMGVDYHSYFSEMNPDLTHNFLNDFNTYICMDNATDNTYKLKEMSITAILSNLQRLNFTKNWGIIHENSKDSKYILLGMDVEGFNMPIRLHVYKSFLIDFLKSSENTTKIPIYEGAEDFYFNGNYIATPILMPLSKEQKEGIKKLDEKHKKTILPTKNLFEHLKFLANSEEYPEHLKKETVVRKGGKAKIVRRPPEKKYIDLESGKIYKKDKTGEMIEIQELNQVPKPEK